MLYEVLAILSAIGVMAANQANALEVLAILSAIGLMAVCVNQANALWSCGDSECNRVNGCQPS